MSNVIPHGYKLVLQCGTAKPRGSMRLSATIERHTREYNSRQLAMNQRGRNHGIFIVSWSASKHLLHWYQKAVCLAQCHCKLGRPPSLTRFAHNANPWRRLGWWPYGRAREMEELYRLACLYKISSYPATRVYRRSKLVPLHVTGSN